MLGSPQVYRERGFSFQMYFDEETEPPHVHIIRGDSAAKFWLTPVRLSWNKGLHSGELRWVLQQLVDQHPFFMEQWDAVQAQVR